MAQYYLIRGNQVIDTIDTDGGDVVALPAMGGGDMMSLLNKQHADNLMANLGLTATETLNALGVADLRSGTIQTIFIGRNPVSLVSGLSVYKLIDIGEYFLWQVDGQQEDLVTLHNQLWGDAPIETLGLLAVVDVFGESFHSSAVRTATGMTNQQALARKDAVATYLESLGYTETAALRNATDEHAQMVGIAKALGYTKAQLWKAIKE